MVAAASAQQGPRPVQRSQGTRRRARVTKSVPCAPANGEGRQQAAAASGSRFALVCARRALGVESVI